MVEPLEPMRPVSVGADVPPVKGRRIYDAALLVCGIAFAYFVLFSGVSTALRWTIGGGIVVAAVLVHWIMLRRSNRAR